MIEYAVAQSPTVKRPSRLCAKDNPLMLPYVTSSLPGIGGCLRATPDDFVVEEIALYPPSGHGQHLYVNITKVG
ncbi:MAG: tRNA pseudouridine(13) synthase TruD, partial [Caldilineaceae bacterium]|nr:tRNA pseudouridine(13) synthase TruD [Caldilineaceae bacterium]